MKIIIANYRYFISGGPERYLFNIKEVLEKNGHTVIPFSIKHPKNKPSQYEKYFVGSIGKGDEVYASEYSKKGLKTKFLALIRLLYSFEAKRKLKKLIKDVQPDIIYLLQYQNKMSASVIDGAFDMKIPVVQRISDYGHICVDNLFYIYQRHEICERCLCGSRINAMKYKCVNNSVFQSFIKVLALKIQDTRKTTKKISAFVFPAQFTATKFKEFGIPSDKIHHIPTFYNYSTEQHPQAKYEDFFLYVGRVDPDKGLMTLIKAFEGTDYKLTIIGSSFANHDEYLKKYLADKDHKITFLGHLDFKEIAPYLQKCLCTICPSEWYENMPNSVLESYAYQKPVIASRLGSLIDLVMDNITGLNFEARNYLDLRSKVKLIYEHRELAVRLGTNGQQRLATEFSENLHYERLIHLFNSVKDESN